MPEAVKVHISGAKELEKALVKLGPIPARKLGKKALKTGGEIIADRARVLVPVDTGRLQDSIVVIAQPPKSNSEVTAVIGFYKPAASYAHLVEFGTAHSPPQPFMRPAIGSKSHDAIAVIGHQLWAGIDAEAKKAKK